MRKKKAGACGSSQLGEDLYRQAMSAMSQYILNGGKTAGQMAGEEVPQIFNLLADAATKGHSDSLYQLGLCRLKGMYGYSVDLDDARILLKAAAEKGSVKARTVLETMQH